MSTIRNTVAAVLLMSLAACGQGVHGGGSAADNEVCQMLGDPTPLFGANASVAGYRGIEQMAASCEFMSADGLRAGEIVTFTSASLAGVTPAAKMQEILQKWATQTATPLAAVDGLGEGAQIATDLPGYQAQIAFVKNNTLVVVQAHTDAIAAAPNADLARRMARAVAAAMH